MNAFRRSISLAALCLSLTALPGCISSGPSTEMVLGKDGLSRAVTTIQTGYPPKDALRKCSNVLQRLELSRVKPQGYEDPSGTGFFSSSEPTKDWPIVADAFSGVAYAKTASNESVELIATWQSDGHTTLKITTQLAPPQHQHLVDLVVAELARLPVAH